MVASIVTRRFAAVAAAMLVVQSASGAVFNPPVPPRPFGQSPSGIQWTAVSTGTALPIRSTGTQNGLPGAVAYWDIYSGRLQIDPKGWDLSLFTFTYTTGTTNPNGLTPGPLTYASGTVPTSSVVSSAVGPQRTLPAGSWSLITCSPARVAGVVSLAASPTLATSYDPGNGASNGVYPYSTNPAGQASVPGWMNQPWSFPTDLVNSGSVASMSVENWKVFGVSGNANANVLGYGDYQGVFQYSINGVQGQQVGALIPVPEPTTAVSLMAAVAMGIGLFGLDRRRRRADVGEDGPGRCEV